MGTLIKILAVMVVLLPAIATAQVDIIRTPANANIDPGSSIVMKLTIETDGLQEGIIVTEVLPDGWIVTSSTPSVDKREGSSVKWFFMNKTGLQNQQITYLLQAPQTPGAVQIQSEWSSIDIAGTNYSGKGTDGRIDVLSAAGGGGSTGSSGGSGGAPSTQPSLQPQPTPTPSTPQQPSSFSCAIGTSKCEGSQVLVCTPQGWVVGENCQYGCVNGICQTQAPSTSPKENSPPGGIDPTGRFLENASTIAGVVFLIAALVVGVRVVRKRQNDEQTPKAPIRPRYEYHPRA